MSHPNLAPTTADPAPTTPGHWPAGTTPFTAPVVEIRNVRRLDVTGTPVFGFVLDTPTGRGPAGQPGSTSPTHVLPLRGWILGSSAPVRELIIHEQGCDVRRIPLRTPRPDVLAAHPHAPAQTCGFDTFLAYLGANRTITYTLLAGLPDGLEVPLCHIDARLGPLGFYAPALEPLMLTTLGRSGSTYAMGILARHPQIVAYKPFEYEARIARYWVDVFAALAQPASYLQSIIPANLADPAWWLGAGDLPLRPYLPDAPVMNYLEADGIEELMAACLARIDAFYERIATLQGQPTGPASPAYFAEKCLPDRNAALLRSLYPARREIILVRDLRDMICSILAFNRKRGFAGFGRENVASDEDYLRYLRISTQQLLSIVAAGSREGAYLLRYEDLIQNPRPTLHAVLEFLRLDPSDEVLDRMLAPAPPEVLAYHVTSGSAAASIGRWRTEFTPALRAAFRTHLEDVSLQLGYPPTEEVPP